MYKTSLLLTLGILVSFLIQPQYCLGKQENLEPLFAGKNYSPIPSSYGKQLMICENGERITVAPTELPINSIKRVQKDGPVIYMEDAQGEVYSFEVDSSKNQATRTEIFRLPLLGTLYNYLMPNYYTLARDREGKIAPWSIAYSDFPNTQAYQTISLFEMIENNPVIIRNRDPWLPPCFHYTHPGPQDFVGTDLTSGGKYVAVSGFHKGEKAFAFRPLNYDLAGHNFLFRYQLEGQSTVTWQPNLFLKLFSRYLGIPQETFSLPREDWQIVKLKDHQQPNILMIENGRRLIVSTVNGENSSYDIYNILERRWESEKEYKDILFSHYNLHPRPWPKREPLSQERTGSRAVLEGKRGVIVFSTQEPLMGTFIEDKTYVEQPIYKVRRTFLDFILNQTAYYNNRGAKVALSLQ